MLRRHCLAPAALVAVAFALVACGTDDGDDAAPAQDVPQSRRGGSSAGSSADDGADEQDEAGAADTDAGEDGTAPVDVVLRWMNPQSCEDAVGVYSAQAWEMLTSMESGDEDEASPFAGMSQDEAIAECERAPEGFDVGADVGDLPEADELEVTEDGDRATVTWAESGSGPDGSSSFSQTWQLVQEDGEWKIDDIGGEMDADVEIDSGDVSGG